VRYCGVVPARGHLQLALLEEVRTPEPPIRLASAFFEPGSSEQVAAELSALPEAVVAVGAPLTGTDGRACDQLLQGRGVTPQPPDPEIAQFVERLAGLRVFAAAGPDSEGPVAEGSYREAAVFETNADGVFCALQGRRLPARRHPLGVQRRIETLDEAHVLDDGGELWHRRIEEIDAVAVALCAHRYAVGHASWLGQPGEGVVVLPGASVPGRFPSEGVLPPVERLQLPPVTR
jgi:predicted nuclease with RNAse H fold